jgi:hypothetical protein
LDFTRNRHAALPVSRRIAGVRWRRRADDHPLTITLHLATIEELFVDPGLTPFDSAFAASSFGPGIDYVVGEMQRFAGAKRTELTVLLPAAEIAAAPDLTVRTMEAIRRYASARSAAAAQTHAVERRQARAVAGGAILFFTVATLLSANYADDGSLLGASGPLLDVLLDGLSVVAWIALWWPFDLVFQAWGHRLEERTYRALPGIALRILPDPNRPEE